MPIFKTDKDVARQLRQQNFRNEKELQRFTEKNLDSLFGIRFLASEYVTSARHGGRIDTLGIDEDHAPVIIEYKWGEKDNIINQGLFYLDWLIDHKDSFTILVNEKIGKDISVNFGSPRLLLVAQSFSRYDTFALNRMGENIQLWSYSRYEDGLFELRMVASSQPGADANQKKITKVSYEKFTVEEHLADKNGKVRELFTELRDRIMSLESGQPVEENVRKHCISYRTNRNFASCQLQQSQIKILIDVPAAELSDPEKRVRDVSKVGRFSTGGSLVVVKDFDDIDYAADLIEESYSKTA